MNDEAAFLAAIAAAPADEALKLVFADWLEERDDPRAAWLRDRVLRPWMGPTFQSPVSALIEALTNDRRVLDVRRACERLGEPAVPGLVELLRHETPRVRAQAALCLRKIGKRAKAAVPALLEALKDRDQDVREKAARALQDIGPPEEAGTATLRDALADENYAVRQAASRALGSMRAKGAVVAELAGRLDSPDPAERVRAARALAELKTAEAVLPLDRALDDPASEVRVAAAVALGQLKDLSAALAPLCRALRSSDTAVRKAAAQQFNDYGWRPPPEALGPLRAALADTSPTVRERVADTLARCGPRAAEAVPDLLANLTHKSSQVRLTAAQALGQLGRDDASALGALVSASADESDAVAAAAVAALGNWSRLPNALAGPLLRYVRRARGADNPWPLHPSVAYGALAKLEAPSAEVINALRQGVTGRDSVEIDAACHALGAVGPAAAAAVPELAEVALLGDQIRAAVHALLRLGDAGVARVAELLGGGRAQVILREARQAQHDALPLLPALLLRLRAAATPNERVEIINALGPLGPNVSAAIPDLLTVVEGPAGADDHPRERALQTLADLSTEALLPHCPRLIALSRRQDVPPGAQCRVAGILARFAASAPEALGRIRELVRETAPAKRDGGSRQWGKSLVRSSIAHGLASLGRGAAVALPEVALLLRDPDNNVREAAINALRVTGDPAAVPHLRRAAAGDAEGWVRGKAVEALGQTGDTSEATVAPILAHLRDENPYQRRTAIEALAALRPDGAAVRQALRLSSKDTDSVVRRRATALLKRLESGK
jgi:uncharacterized protein (TIGR02996 family)